VKGNRWKRAAWTATVVVAVPFCAAHAQSTAPDAGVTPVSSTEPDAASIAAANADQDLKTLQDSSAPSDQRDLAALNLVASHNDSIKPALADLLRNNRTAQLSIARAMGTYRWADPEFIDPLLALLSQQNPDRAGAAAMALAQYQDNNDILKDLLRALQVSVHSPEMRAAILPSIGLFSQKDAAEALVDEAHDDNSQVEAAAGDALMDMTGLVENGHNTAKWQQWWDQNKDASDADFQVMISKLRAAAYSRLVARRVNSDAAATKLLYDLYQQSPSNKLLLQYLRSLSPAVRELGANLVVSRRDSLEGPSPELMQEVRRHLTDPSADVRAAAARALNNDADSAAVMVAQLRVEHDDMVRMTLIHSLAQLHDREAIEAMLQILHDSNSMPVQAEAADGLRVGADVILRDPDLKNRTIAELTNAFNNASTPDMQRLRSATVGALAAMRDPSLVQLFLNQLDPNEGTPVRVAALRGLGNLVAALRDSGRLDDSNNLGGQVANFLRDDNPDIRLAAVDALQPVSQPGIYIRKLVDQLNTDTNDQVRAETWRVLQGWMNTIDETDLVTLIDDLKEIDPNKQLQALTVLCNRLAADAKNTALSADQQALAAKNLATYEENLGDLLMTMNTQDQAAQAADRYQDALKYWKANNGTQALDKLSGDVTRALLAARKWQDAATFASGVIRDYANNPDMQPTQETVSREFKITAENMAKSDDPQVLADSDGLFAAINQMNPPLPPSYADQLSRLQQQISDKKAAEKQSGGQ